MPTDNLAELIAPMVNSARADPLALDISTIMLAYPSLVE
jgi:hypothetical protein